MTTLVMPKTGTRIPPLQKANVGPYVRAEYDKSIYTWGIPNNLIKTMAWLPRLAETEVDYANSFIFDVGTYAHWPSPEDPTASVLYPLAGFVDRITKELVINVVSLLNRSRYSITHHSVIGFNTLAAELLPQDANERKQLAEAMMLHLVDATGAPDFENKSAPGGGPLYTTLSVLLPLGGLWLRAPLRSSVNILEILRSISRLMSETTTIRRELAHGATIAGGL